MLELPGFSVNRGGINWNQPTPTPEAQPMTEVPAGAEFYYEWGGELRMDWGNHSVDVNDWVRKNFPPGAFHTVVRDEDGDPFGIELWQRIDIEADYNNDGAVQYKLPGSDRWAGGNHVWEKYGPKATVHIKIVERSELREWTLEAWMEVPL